MEWFENRTLWRCSETVPGILRGIEKLASWSLHVGLNSSLKLQGGLPAVTDRKLPGHEPGHS